jgi:MFS family permease
VPSRASERPWCCPQALSLLSAAFPPETRGRAIGIFAGITGLATLSGPVIGGAVAQGLAWQWIFWLNVPIGIALIPLTRRHVAESLGPRTPLDVTGLALSGAGAAGLVWGLLRGNAVGWGSPQVYGPLAAGAVLLAVFVGWERRARSPMVPVSIFPNGPFVSANAAGFLMTGAMFGGVFFLAEYLQAEQGDGPLAAGVRTLPLTMALLMVAPLAGRLVGRLGERPIVVAGVLAQAAGFGWMALDAGGGYPALVPAMVLAGAGISAALPAAQNAAVGAVPAQAIGVASGVFNAMRQLGGTFGVAIATVAFAGFGDLESPTAESHGFRAALTAAAAMSAVGALASLGLRARRRRAVPALQARPLSLPREDVSC